MLDHILLGSNDLNTGIAFVEGHTGVRAAIGGVHPGRGTRNALLSLGERRYLEIIAPDPAQDKVPDFAAPLVQKLKSLSDSPARRMGRSPGQHRSACGRLKAAGIAFDGPRDGSRSRPDGRLLKWKTLNLADDHKGVLPFFIEWDATSTHPSSRFARRLPARKLHDCRSRSCSFEENLRTARSRCPNRDWQENRVACSDHRAERQT